MRAAKKLQQDQTTERDIQMAARVGEEMEKAIKTNPRKGFFDEIGAYMAPLRKYPVLTDQSDYAYLFNAYANGTEIERRRARDLVVYGNIRLVLRVAFRYTGRGLPIVDLLQEGVIGLMRAIEKYDIAKGFRFSTYAHGWIRQGITRALCDINESQTYRVPVHYMESMQLIRRICGQLYIKDGRWPKELKVYEQVKGCGVQAASRLSLADVVQLMRAVQTGNSPERLDAPVSPWEDDGDTFGDQLCVGPPKTETVIEARRLYAEYREAVTRIEEAVDKLPPRFAMVVRLRFGLGEFEAMTLEEVGQRYEVTRERIRQIEVEALGALEATLGITPAEITEILDVVQDLEVLANAI